MFTTINKLFDNNENNVEEYNNENNVEDEEDDIVLISHDIIMIDILFDILNNLTDKITFDFSESCIRIIFLNKYETAIYYVKLNSESFTKYKAIQKVSFDLRKLELKAHAFRHGMKTTFNCNNLYVLKIEIIIS
jgi:DNA polymerase III sliding clamp (beta) subunit (PCNA family)